MSALSAPAHPRASSALTRWVATHPLVTFFVLANAITWGIIGSVMLALGSGVLSEESLLVAILQELYSFGPALAALVAAAAIARWRGLRALLGSLDPRRIGLGWYPLALVAPPLVLVLAEAVLYGAAPLAGLAAQGPVIVTGYLVPVLTTVLLTTGIAEELGWRGFAQPRLQARYGPLAGSLILGAGAALWHVPNVVLRPGGLTVFALQALYSIIVAVLFTWVYNRNRGSALIVALFHAALNTSSSLVAPLVPIADPVLFAQHIYTVMLTVVSLVALLLIIVTRGRLAYKPEQEQDMVDHLPPVTAPQA